MEKSHTHSSLVLRVAEIIIRHCESVSASVCPANVLVLAILAWLDSYCKKLFKNMFVLELSFSTWYTTI